MLVCDALAVINLTASMFNAALFFLVIGAFGALSCLPARWYRHIWALEK